MTAMRRNMPRTRRADGDYLQYAHRVRVTKLLMYISLIECRQRSFFFLLRKKQNALKVRPRRRRRRRRSFSILFNTLRRGWGDITRLRKLGPIITIRTGSARH